MNNSASRIRHLFSIAAIALAATLGAGLVHAGALSLKPIAGTLDSRMNARFDVLTAKAQTQGTVRVIVRLKQRQPSRQAFAAEGAQAYQAAIASAQSRVMTTLAKPVSAHAFETVPYMAMEVDAMDLSALRQSPEVEAVFEDRMLFPALADNVSLIGADKAAAAGYSGAGQTIAILDTGVDKTHPDLAGKVVAEACFSSPSDR